MKKHERREVLKRLFSFTLAMVMLVGYLPATASAAQTGPGKIADPATFERLEPDNAQYLYKNDTLHAGKVTVDKSVSKEGMTHQGVDVSLNDDDNFLVTVSQMAQVMALTTKMDTPVDVVFVLDFSSSMNKPTDKILALVEQTNNTVDKLMSMNNYNRVGIVAYSGKEGVSSGAGANVLTPLDHYTGDAASNHLTWVNSSGNPANGPKPGVSSPSGSFYLKGRANAGKTAGLRNANKSGTNIHAGVVLGGNMLMEADTTVTINGKSVTRMPFLIIMSDGEPSYATGGDNWYNPSNLANHIGNLYPAYGLGFLPALTAAYYKARITERYYGSNASATKRCFIYSVGLGLDFLKGNNVSDSQMRIELANRTINPAEKNATITKGSVYEKYNEYWKAYLAGEDFSVQTTSTGGNHPIYKATIDATDDYILNTKLNPTGDYRYNDDYFPADDADELGAAFDQVVLNIQKQAVASPTQVSTGDYNFDGYVTFTDVIGEYMEVKDMKGILVGDTFYQGRAVAEKLSKNNDPAFNEMALKVVATRFRMANPTLTDAQARTKAAELIAASVAAGKNGKTQAYFTSGTDYSNSLVWYGKSVSTGDGFEHQVQYIAPAEDDSIAYLSTAAIPADADTVCRSFLFYGTAQDKNGQQIANQNHEYMYFMVRVERNLSTMQQTVTVSVPASLLSVEKVYITEDTTGNTPVYTAKVEEAKPAHVIYEVGLRGDINAYNVGQVVSSAYTGEAVNGAGHQNYKDGTYYFFTNDWDRTKDTSTHTRAMSKATFYAASNNPYYTYQKDTYLMVNGNKIKSVPSDGVYYEREVYTWSGAATNGEYKAQKKTEKINLAIPAGTQPGENSVIRADGEGYLYIPAGTYTAAVMSPDGSEEVHKGSNNLTNTSVAVAHPARTGDASDSHYTVYLGNNGVLPLKAKQSKTVSVNPDPNATEITDDNGKAVMVGDTLSYYVEVVNTTNKTADVTVTDLIPAGTKLVDGSISHGGEAKNGTITWTFEDMEPGEDKKVTVSFEVTVTEDALTGEHEINDITNTATVKISNTVLYNTNTTNNPPEGKKTVDGNTNPLEGELKVGDVITYRIRYFNDNEAGTDASGKPATSVVTVTDTIPAGTTYVPDSASHQENLTEVKQDGVVTGLKWEIPVVNGDSGVVSFRVAVDASAMTTVKNRASIQIGNHAPRSTNETSNTVGKGDISITKTVVSQYSYGSFDLILRETGKKLNGKFTVQGGEDKEVTFVNGVATDLKINHGETLTIVGLPLGAEITVAEAELGTGWSNAFTQTFVYATKEDSATQAVEVPNVGITNTYTVAPVQFQLKGTKSFSGSNFPKNINFVFTAVQVDEDGSEYSGAGNPITMTAYTTYNDKSSETFSFDVRTFTGEVNRYYSIREEAVDFQGITVDATEYLLHIQTKLNQQKACLDLLVEYKLPGDTDWTAMTLEQNAEGVFVNKDVSVITFANKYEPLKSEPVRLAGEKVMTGRYLEGGKFSFQLIRLAEDLKSGTVIDTVTNTAGTTENPYKGTFQFADIVYTAADMDGQSSKTFNYVIREVNGGAANTTYSKDLYQVAVEVKDDNGALKIVSKSVTKYVLESGSYGAGKSAEKISFTNEFDPSDVSVILTGTKKLTGAGADGLPAEDYTFQVFEMEYVENTWVETTKVAAVAGNGDGRSTADGYEADIIFSPINFTPEMFNNATVNGTLRTKQFRYIVKEVIPASTEPSYDPSIRYDVTKYEIGIEATYNVENGTISVNVVGATDEGNNHYSGMDFHNIRNQQVATFAPAAVKHTETTADNLPANLRFSFRVVNLENGKVESTGLSDPAVKNSADGEKIVFTDMQFDYTQVGQTFWYLIEEATVNISDGIDYSEAQYVLKLTVDRDANNALKVSHAYYTLADGKKAEDVKAALKDKKNPESLLNAFDQNLSFTNIFDAKKTLNLTASKELTGGLVLKKDSFEFRMQLLNKNGAVYTPGNSVINGANGMVGDDAAKISFGTLNFTFDQTTGNADFKISEDTQTGTSVYEYNVLLSEIEPDSAKIEGVEYDDAKYIVAVRWEVTAIDGGTSGTSYTFNEPYVYGVYPAVAEGSDYKKGTAIKEVEDDKTIFGASNGTENATVDLGVTFHNHYQIQTGTTAEMVATKVLNGRDLKEGEFGFELYRVSDGGEVFVESATNGQNGKIRFTRTYPATISRDFFIDNVANFVYHMKEIGTGAGGISYSGAEYWVKVTVTHDPATASLSSVVKYFSDAACQNGITAAEVVFENTYTTNDASFTPQGSKVLYGANNDAIGQKDYHFSFEVVELEEDGTEKTVKQGEKTYAKVVSTGSNQEDGSIVFTPIPFTRATADPDIFKTAGTHDHYYKIRENVGSQEGVSYSGADHFLKLSVYHDGKGNLEVKDPVYYSSLGENGFAGEDEVSIANPVFENHYGPGYTVVNLNVKKTVLIKDRADEKYPFAESDFNFVIHADNGDGQFDPATDTELHKGTNDAPNASGIANVNFGSLVYTKDQMGSAKEKTFVYFITELDPAIPGMAWDTSVIKVEVKVTHDGYGNLTATSTYYKGDAVQTAPLFENVYTARPTSVNLTGSKTLINKALLKDEFTFVMTEDSSNPVQLFGGSKEVHNEAGNPNHGTIKFLENQTLSAPGTYTFTITEKNAGAAGYTYDATVYTVKIQVNDNYQGQLVVASTDVYVGNEKAGAVAFTNSYTAGNLTNVNLNTAIGAQKQIVDINGAVIDPAERTDLYAGFQFEVLNNRGENAFGDGVYGQSDSNGVITFPVFHFPTAGEYHYTIREVEGQKSGFTYDPVQWTVHILVRYNEGPNDVIYQDENGNDVTVKPGQLYIVPSEVHTFPMHAASAEEQTNAQQTEVLPVFTNVYHPTPADVAIRTNKVLNGREMKDHEFDFVLVENINGTDYVRGRVGNHANGEVHFGMNYTLADLGGETSKTFHYTIYEILPEEAVSGKLDGVTYDQVGKPVSVTVVDDNGVLKVNGENVVTVQANGNIVNSYTAADGTATVYAMKYLEHAALQDKQFTFELVDAEGNIASAQNNADGEVFFNLQYSFEDMLDETGTRLTEKVFTYTLREKAEGYAGIVYDEKTYTVTVTVTDDQLGHLVTSVSYDDIPAFINFYEGTSVTATISAKKNLVGRTLKAGEFTFELLNDKGEPAAEPVTNDAEGNVSFALRFTEAGEYTYTIREKKGTDDLIDFDTNAYLVTVDVDADSKGYLSYAVRYETADQAAPIFHNVHTPGAITVTLKGTKELTGAKMEGNEFKFVATDSNGKELGVGSNDKNGNIAIDVAFDTAGKYKLTVTEVDSGKKGMTYDAAKFQVVVEIEDVDGVLTEKVTYPESGIKFSNSYRTPDEKIMVTLEGTKELAGRKLKDEEFEFEARNKEGDVVATGTNKASGEIIFTDITFTKAGKYEFTVNELKGSTANITYDDSTFKVTVEIVDDNGVLSKKVTYPEGGIVFANTYTAPNQKVEVKLEGNKKLSGRKLKANEFEFEVRDAEDQVVATGTNQANGKIKFTELTFTKAGKYELTVSEIAGDEKGMTYDTDTFKVTVNVTETEDGLSAKVSYPKGGIKFANTYRTPDEKIELRLEGTKKLTGRKLKAGEFEFEVRDAKDKVVATGTNKANGKITFTKLAFTSAGKYKLTVSEVKGKASNITYDDTEFKVTVEVMEDDGVMSAKVHYPEDGVVFKNTYKKPPTDSADTGDHTPIVLLTSMMALSFMGILMMVFIPKRNRRGKYSK